MFCLALKAMSLQRWFEDSKRKKDQQSLTFQMVFSVVQKKMRLKVFIPFLIIAVFLIDISGVLLHFYEIDFDTKFEYPLKGDVRKYMEQLRLGQELEQVLFS